MSDAPLLEQKRDPWMPEPHTWGPLPLSPEDVKEMAKRAGYWERMWPKLSMQGVKSAYFDLAIMVKLLCEDFAQYDIVEPADQKKEG